MPPTPRYIASNCVPAYQLNWALSVFGKVRLPSPSECIELLQIEVAKDHIKVLEYQFREPNVALFFLSSQPQSTPSQIVQSIKGRW